MKETYKALIIGDVVGECGRQALEKTLAELQWELDVDFTVVNGENISGGKGLSRRGYNFLCRLGVDAITLGNHIWGHRDITQLLAQAPNLCRPANLPPGTAGCGWRLLPCGDVQIAVVNLLGRVYMNMPALDCPFHTVQALLAEIQAQTPIILVDFHAETTSEKLALANFLDGRVTAVWGTHTHVQTNDARLLPRGTAYLSDAGMTGARDSVLGVETDGVVARYLSGRPTPFVVAHGIAQLNGLLLEFAPDGKARNIQTVNREVPLL